MQEYKWIYQIDDLLLNNIIPINLLGGKGAALFSMKKIGLSIPPAFTITTSLCDYYYSHDRQFPESFFNQLSEAIAILEKTTQKKFGDPKNPLLISVRSGSPVSMPGMMDTLLNLGLNKETVEGLAEQTKNKKFALDCYRRLMEMFTELIYKSSVIKDHLTLFCIDQHVISANELTYDQLTFLIRDYEEIFLKNIGMPFPQDVQMQLYAAVRVVLESWMNERAIIYRQLNCIDEKIGTAITIQSMVFGNLDANSATGVLFTRDPSTGDKILYGEFMVQAQGEDIVAGTHTPLPIEGGISFGAPTTSLKELMPLAFNELFRISRQLEKHYKDMQDIEFTIEKNKLYILQTRSGKRTLAAAIKIAVNLAQEGLITHEEALMRIPALSLEQILHKQLKEVLPSPLVIAQGLPASPGAATGHIILGDDLLAGKGKDVILVRKETCPDDIKLMNESVAILTLCGGMTSHAAVIARGMGKPAICGAHELSIDEKTKSILKDSKVICKEGDLLTIDGTNGQVILGEALLEETTPPKEFALLMKWVNRFQRLEVRANAETLRDIKTALLYNASGLGLVRTEHMFFEEKKMTLMQQVILAENAIEQQQALDQLLPLHQKDFIEIFKQTNPMPVNIRLLDPPLHEFIPSKDGAFSDAQTINRIERLKEHNPMLGHRGARLGVTDEIIYQMQVKAIVQAALLEKPSQIEIMIPFITNTKELQYIIKMIKSTINELDLTHAISYKLGAMIELPRAALIAGELAAHIDFMSFGTNDLTQTTYGISRDDGNKFIPTYKQKKIFDFDPFVHIDEEGVGRLMEIAIKEARLVNPNIKIGVCGEHGGDPQSIHYFDRIGVDYVSCSPHRIPVAKLAAAQSYIKNHKYEFSEIMKT